MQHKCYGCMICAEICPVKAIKIKEDEEGFRYILTKAKKETSLVSLA